MEEERERECASAINTSIRTITSIGCAISSMYRYSFVWVDAKLLSMWYIPLGFDSMRVIFNMLLILVLLHPNSHINI